MARLALVCTLLALGVTTAEEVSADDFAPLGWSRVFTDEFDGTSVNRDDWDVLNRRDSFNNEKQYYLPAQVTAGDGIARITATNEPFGGKQYRSGLIRTWQEWSYGRFEIRADLPTSQGMWPAIWLLPRTVPWPTGGEIDIMENRGSQPTLVSSAYHWQNDPSIPCCGARQFVYDEYQARGEDARFEDFHEGFHTYATEWEPGVIRFYVDGNRHFTINQDDNITVFDTAKSLIINLAIGGDFGGDPDGTTVWPQQFDIDYVRIWQRENGFTGLVNGGFDENGGTLNDWDTWNTTGANLTIADDASSNGGSALRLAPTPGAPAQTGAYQGVAINGGERLRARVDSLVPNGQTLDAGTEMQMKVEFYTEFGAGYGSAQFLGEEILTIADASHPAGDWRTNQLVIDAPASAVEARYTLIMSQGATPAGAGYFDTASLVAVPDVVGDFNFDGAVNAADYTVWRDTLGSTFNLAADANGNGVVDTTDYAFWQAAYQTASAAAVPEPGALWLLMLAGAAVSRRR